MVINHQRYLSGKATDEEVHSILSLSGNTETAITETGFGFQNIAETGVTDTPKISALRAAFVIKLSFVIKEESSPQAQKKRVVI